MLYLDSSALVKCYIEESDSEVAEQLISDADRTITSQLSALEVRRNLARLLSGDELLKQQRAFQRDVEYIDQMEIDSVIIQEATRVAEQTLCRSLDAIHVASALRLGATTSLLTFDLKMARAARAVGLTVIGA